MSGSSRYSRVLSTEAGQIERRLRSLEKNLAAAGANASTGAKETAESFGDAIASALFGWADRFRRSASSLGESLGQSLGEQSETVGKDAARLGGVALRRVSGEIGQRPLLTVAVAVGVGILIGLASRRWD